MQCAPFSLTSVQFVPLFSWIALLQVLLAKACPCGSAALFFFIFYWLTFVYIERRGGYYKLLLLFEFGSIMVFLKYLCCIGHGLNARKNYIVLWSMLGTVFRNYKMFPSIEFQCRNYTLFVIIQILIIGGCPAVIYQLAVLELTICFFVYKI